jgi:polyisoprenoid-binding protein YceI
MMQRLVKSSRWTGWVVAGALWVSSAPVVWATTYAIDRDHSSASFKIRHLFSKVEGTFREFEGRFDYVPGAPEQWKVEATIQTASIDTRVAQRDEHLRTADFFDAASFPTLTFTSTQVTEATPTSAKLHGLLTLHGVQKPVVLDLAMHGEGKDPWGNVRSGFTATTTINRKEFGLVWNKTVETGQLLVGEEVEITLEIEGLAQSQ